MNSRIVMTGLLLLAMVCLLPVAALAQGNSSLRGTVTDPTGAVVPGATIEITNMATEASQTAETDTVGQYLFPQVAPGTYRLTATSEGLVQVGMTGIDLPVSQPVTVNIQFTDVGSVSDVVTVEAEATSINTVDASIGNAIGTRPILQLPMAARNVVGLLAMQPGVVLQRDNAASTFEGEGEFDTRHGSVNGGRSDQANITLDGVDVNDQQYGTAFTSVLRVTLDSVQEFRTTTLNAGADEGRSSGAQVAMITKGGTNELHGSAYWYHRNTATTANDFFLNKQGAERPILKRNIFGGSIGGPVMRNRLFYFFNYEGRTDRSEDSIVQTVPSAELRQGIFQYIRTDGSVGTLGPNEIAAQIDPLGLGPNPNALSHMQKYPMPNDDTVGDGLNTKGFRFVAPLTLDWHTYIGRLDYYIDSAARHQLFLRGNYQDDSETDLPQFPGEPPRYQTLTTSKGLGAGYNATLSPTLFSSFRYGLTRQAVNQAGASDQAEVTFRRLDNLHALTRSLIRTIPVHTIREDMNWIKGAHQLKFGGVVRLIGNNRTNYANSYHTAVLNGSWMVGSGALAPSDTVSYFQRNASDAMTLLLGLVTQGEAKYNYLLDGSVQAAGTPVRRDFAQENYELYVMDTWRITRGLTVTAGLRWNLHPPVHETNGYQTSAIPNLGDWFGERGSLAAQGKSQADAGLVSYVLRDDPQGSPLYAFHKKDIAPRIALAYSPQVTDGFLGKLFGGPGKTSFRAGFGMFYDNFGQGIIRLYDTEAFGLSTSLQSPAGGFSPATAPRFTSLTDIPSVLIPDAPPGGFPQQAPEAFTITNSIDQNIESPYSIALNFSIGRELPRNFFIEASYVGRLSRKSLIQRDLAQPTNLLDPESGQTYWEAVNQLAAMRDSGVPVTTNQTIPWFENMLPDVADYFIEGNATQNMLEYMYTWFEPYIAWGGPDDFISVQADLDNNWLLPPTRLGLNAMFSSQYSAAAAWSSLGHGNYHAGQLTLRKRFSDGIQFDVNYTLSKSMDLASGAESVLDYYSMPINAFNLWDSWAVSDYDMRHQVNANWVVELPFGHGKKWGGNWNSVLDHVLGGWQLSGLWRMTSGLPYNIGNGGTWPTNWNMPGYATQVGPTPTQGIYKDAVSPDGSSGPNIFADPVTAVDSWEHTRAGGTGQRNGVRGDGYFTIDTGLGKRFQLPMEGHSLQFRWETFNLTNTPSFDGAPEDWSLGQGGSFGKYSYMLTNPRVMQFGLRYEF